MSPVDSKYAVLLLVLARVHKALQDRVIMFQKVGAAFIKSYSAGGSSSNYSTVSQTSARSLKRSVSFTIVIVP